MDIGRSTQFPRGIAAGEEDRHFALAPGFARSNLNGMKTLNSLFFAGTLLGLLTLAGCQTSGVDPINEEAGPYDPVLVVNVSENFTTERLQEVAVRAFRARGWEVTDTSDDAVTGRLIHRGYDSTVKVELAPGTITFYSDSWATDDMGDRSHREHPGGWIRNLASDMKAFLGIAE